MCICAGVGWLEAEAKGHLRRSALYVGAGLDGVCTTRHDPQDPGRSYDRESQSQHRGETEQAGAPEYEPAPVLQDADVLWPEQAKGRQKLWQRSRSAPEVHGHPQGGSPIRGYLQVWRGPDPYHRLLPGALQHELRLRVPAGDICHGEGTRKGQRERRPRGPGGPRGTRRGHAGELLPLGGGRYGARVTAHQSRARRQGAGIAGLAIGGQSCQEDRGD